ncbi:MAG: zinc carboxypeptidase [Planctomycetes bacterium]|nr:zinc carboxypeptidase [Planctomycetota bacterium]
MRSPSLVLGLLSACALLTPALAQEPPHHLVEVRLSGPGEMQRLLALDLDLASCTAPRWPRRVVEVIATDEDLATLRRERIEHEVKIARLEEWHAAQAARFPITAPETLTPPLGQGAMGGHYTLAQIEAILDALQQANPAIVTSKQSLGNSIEGRPLWMVKISDNAGVDENEPEVLYDALHHSREPLSMEATLLFMDWLVTGYGSDPLATFLVNERELYFVPCVNPDGYEYNRATNPSGGGLWRKNRRDNGNGTFGVDLNRNYATGWSAPNGGNSTAPSSDTYRGTAPFSEPETLALESFCQSRSFAVVFSTHTYTDVLLWPYGWTTTLPSNASSYQLLGGWLTEENGIAQGPVSTTLYIAAGGSVDHHHEVRGSYSFTAELGRSNEGGFWPVGPTIIDIATRHQPMFRKFALSAGTSFDIASVAIAEGPGANGNGTVEAGEEGTLVVSVRNDGIASGSATLDLSAVSAGLVVLQNQASVPALAGLSSATNAATPLRFRVPAGFVGPTATLRLSLTGDGKLTTRDVVVQLVPIRVLVDDDFEVERGFAREAGGTATTGLFERGVTQATSSGGVAYQPSAQTTPGGTRCWVTDGRAGTSAGTYDVDGGHTSLVSPRFDLAHLAQCAAAFDLWYAESTSDDALEIAVSRDDGASWSTLLSRTSSTNGWTRMRLDLGTPLTDRMRLRVRAQDLSPSLVECLVDGFALEAPAADGALTLLGSGATGTSVRAGWLAPSGGFAALLGSTSRIPPLPLPGIGGALLLDPLALQTLASAPVPASARGALDLPIPADPLLVGLQYHLQLAWLSGASLSFGGNAQTLVVR